MVIPKSVTNIGSSAFGCCTSLKAISVDALNPIYCSVEGVLFDKSLRSLLAYPGGRAASYSVPNTVTAIGDAAFIGCADLTSTTIPNSVTRIGAQAFKDCSKLTSITIPNSVTTIGPWSFYVTGLTNINVPASVANLELSAFGHCTRLTAITVDPLNPFYSSADGVLFDKDQTILIQYPGGRAGSYSIPNTVTSIENAAFQFCSGINSVTIPSSVTNIGWAAFMFCANLTNVTIPKSVASIGDYAFASPSLAQLYFHGNAPSFGRDLLFGSTNAIVYYFPGTTGWAATIGGRPAVLWNPQIETGAGSFGVGLNGFGFIIRGTPNIPIVVEFSTNLNSPEWIPLQSCLPLYKRRTLFQ